MRPRRLILALSLLLGGCISPSREAAAEARGFERGYGQAVKEQYWHLQNQQRQPSQSPAPTPDKP